MADHGGPSNLSSPNSPIKSGPSEEEPSTSTEPNDDFRRDLMTSSYTEISFGDTDSDDQTDVDDSAALSDCGDRAAHQEPSGKSLHLGGSLSLPQLSSTIVSWSEQTNAEYESYDVSGKGGQRPQTSDTDAYAEGGEDIERGEDVLVTYVAEDLEEKLRISSPPSSRSCSLVSDDNVQDTTPDSSMSLSPQMLNELERQTLAISRNVNSVISHISEYTHNVTSLTADFVKKYENCLFQTCDEIDANIKLMYQLMAKCEELNQAMIPIDSLNADIREVKRLLELFERSVENKAFS